MTEELKKEAEEYCADNCGDCYGCHKKYRKNKNCEKIKSMIKTYLAAAEPREKRIAELEEENAELRKDKKELCHSISEGGKACVYLNEQLTKAKEIIKEYLSIDYVQLSSCDKVIDLRDKTEQFLNSEVKK